MKPYDKNVFRNLAMVSQLGISMLTPIFLCLYIGYRLDKYFHTRWIIVLMLILGVVSGIKLAYDLLMHIIKQEEEDAKQKKIKMSEEAIKKDTSKPKVRSRVYKEEDANDDQTD